MATLDTLKSRAAELWAQLQEVSRPEPEPKPTTNIEAETEAALQRLARATARKRVATALNAELSTLNEEISRLEEEERRQQAEAVRAELDAGREELVRSLRGVLAQCNELHTLQNREAALRQRPNYLSTYTALERDLRNAARANLGDAAL